MDEFGSGNSNLHAHGVYVGPYLPQKLLSQWWNEITGGSFIVSIKAAPSFEKALSHSLKYPSKFWDAPPSRLVELEVAFHKVRRFHTLARFYNPPETQNEPGMESDAKDEAKRCPFCGSYLRTPTRKQGWSSEGFIVGKSWALLRIFLRRSWHGVSWMHGSRRSTQ